MGRRFDSDRRQSSFGAQRRTKTAAKRGANGVGAKPGLTRSELRLGKPVFGAQRRTKTAAAKRGANGVGAKPGLTRSELRLGKPVFGAQRRTKTAAAKRGANGVGAKPGLTALRTTPWQASLRSAAENEDCRHGVSFVSVTGRPSSVSRSVPSQLFPGERFDDQRRGMGRAIWPMVTSSAKPDMYTTLMSPWSWRTFSTSSGPPMVGMITSVKTRSIEPALFWKYRSASSPLRASTTR